MLTVFKVLLGKIEYHKPRLCIDFLDLQIFSVERWTSWTVEDLLVYVKAYLSSYTKFNNVHQLLPS